MNMIYTRKILCAMLLLLYGGVAAWAQFNPSNPPDPYMLYKVVAKATGGNYTSGSGSYTMGTQVRLNTSAASSVYEFLYWTKNGEQYTTDRYFTYTVEDANVEFVAVYRFNPDNPSDPQTSNQFRLYLQPYPEGSCSFNCTSGAKVEAGQQVWLSPSPSQNFVFEGWYLGEEKVSSSAAFYFNMPAANTTLTARYKFVPSNPGDPEGNQEEVDMGYERGDVNKDKNVDMQDVVLMVNYVIGNNPSNFHTAYADVNNDGSTDLQDVVILVNKIIGK